MLLRAPFLAAALAILAPTTKAQVDESELDIRTITRTFAEPELAIAYASRTTLDRRLAPVLVLFGDVKDQRRHVLQGGFLESGYVVAVAGSLDTERALALSKKLRIQYRVERNRLHVVGVGPRGVREARTFCKAIGPEATSLLMQGDADKGGDSLPHLSVERFGRDGEDVLTHIELARRQPITKTPLTTIDRTLDDFHDAATSADYDRYFGLFADGAVFLGTDSIERWTLDEFQKWAGFAFDRESAWMFTPLDRRITLAPGGRVAWFDEDLHSRSYGTCRGSGVLVADDSQAGGRRWRIAQYNLSVPIPNDLLRAFVKQIREREGSGESAGK